MLADDAPTRLRPGGSMVFVGAAGSVVAVSRLVLDNTLNDDPAFAGRKDRAIAGRTEDAYVAGQWRYGELFFGRTARNWGPHQLQGLVLSNAPYTYDHLYGRLGSSRLALGALLARLEDHNLVSGERVQRYIATHRLSIRKGGFEAALAESFLYTGVGRGMELALMNPLAVYGLGFRNEQQDGNLLVSVQLASRTRVGNLSGELLVDDVQIDRCDTLCREPSSYALTLSATGVPVRGATRAFASYARVSALAYRTPNLAERYASFDTGLGAAASDYDEARIGLDMTPGAFATQLYVAYRRQGEGDYRSPFPSPDQYERQPGIFEGSIVHVRRIGASGGGRLRSFELRGDLGYNWVRNPSDGVRRTGGFEARARLAWIPGKGRRVLAP